MNIKSMYVLFVLTFIPAVFTGCDALLDADEPGNLVPKTVAEDPMLPKITINGTQLHAETFGDISNPIIIFLHGGPGSDYRSMISEIGIENASRYVSERSFTNAGLTRLQNEYFLVFFDQRGAGLSERQDRGSVDFDMYVKDLDALIDYYLGNKVLQTGVADSQVTLFGWSYGGILSTGYINRHPEKIKNVVLYEPGPLSKDVWTYFMDNSTPLFNQVGKKWLAEYLLAKDHISGDSHERADYQVYLIASRAQPELHENKNAPAWRYGAYIMDDDLDFALSDNFDITSNILNSYKGGMLLINGSKTASEYPEYAAKQRGFYPVSEYQELDGVGHSGPWEKPEELSTLIRAFLQQ